jgi:hypothetical protein
MRQQINIYEYFILSLDEIQFEDYGYLKYKDIHTYLKRIIEKNKMYNVPYIGLYNVYDQLKKNGYFEEYAHNKYLYKYVNKNSKEFIASNKPKNNNEKKKFIIQFDH